MRRRQRACVVSVNCPSSLLLCAPYTKTLSGCSVDPHGSTRAAVGSSFRRISPAVSTREVGRSAPYSTDGFKQCTIEMQPWRGKDKRILPLRPACQALPYAGDLLLGSRYEAAQQRRLWATGAYAPGPAGMRNVDGTKTDALSFERVQVCGRHRHHEPVC
jgi:hypothetical protein